MDTRADFTNVVDAAFTTRVKRMSRSEMEAARADREAELVALNQDTAGYRNASAEQQDRGQQLLGELQVIDRDWLEPHPGHAPMKNRRPAAARAGGGYGRIEGLGKAFLDGLAQGNGGDLRAALDGTSGGSMTPQWFAPQILDLPQRALFVRSLIPTVAVTSDKVDYLRQSVATQNAAPVAAAALKPTSVYSVERIEVPVTTIAHISEALDRMLLSDEDQLIDFIDNQLRLGVLLAEENQILNGNGTPPQLRGILQTAGIQTQAKGADAVPDAIYKAITKVRLTFREVDGIVLHPNDWQDVRLLKAADGTYISAPMLEDDPSRMWGIPVVTSAAMTEGTGLVGAFGVDATVYDREQARVTFTESGLGDTAGQEMFSRNQVRFRGESRIALGVARPASFCTVTGI
jgi:HK97 family phage major capsid protein